MNSVATRSIGSRAGEGCLYQAVASRITTLIEEGTLRPGERVPSVRRISRQESVSIATAIQAYRVLESRGLIEARPQSGYYVRARVWSPPAEPERTPAARRSSRIGVAELILRIQEVSERSDGMVNLGTAPPSPDAIPTRQLLRSLAAAGRANLRNAARCEAGPGNRPLRTQIARRAIEAGCTLSPDDIITTVGCQEALHLCLRAVTKPGDTVAVESPCYFGVLQLMEVLGLKACELATHPRDGICLENLEQSLDSCRIKACLLVPNFSNPLGSLMADEKKSRLVAMLARRRIPLIEDDVFGDLSFDNARPKAAKAFDTDGGVLHCSSFSKTLAPNYRVGWCAPGRFYERVQLLKYVTTLSTPTLPQMAIADFLVNGGYDFHLRRIRRVYADQVARVTEAIAKYFPQGTRVTRPQGGYILWVELPPAINSLELFDKALGEGIAIAPGPIFSATQKFQNFVRINCGNPWSDAIDNGLLRLGRILERLAG